MLKSGDVIQIQIEKMANRGKGLARYNEQVVFVPFSAPGDTLDVKIGKVSKNFVDAEIIEIVTPSAMRIQAPCPYYTQCGGCHFQHIQYPMQVEIKDGLVKETLLRALGSTSLGQWLKPIASPHPWNYRNRIQVHFEGPRLGFVKRNSHSVVPIDSCLIAEGPLNEEIKKIKSSPQAPDAKKLELLLDKKMQVHQRDLNSKGQPVLFGQVNRFANELLIDVVVQKVNLINPKGKIFDLYSGDGNFLVNIAKTRPRNECIGVELNAGLVKQGREEVKVQKLNARFVASSVESYMESLSIDLNDIIVLDPPRVGCDPKALTILAAAPRSRVIYVSCEPTTLARDLRLLKETAIKWGLDLRVHSVQTIDMFPQTEHIETVVEFSIEKIDTPTTTH
jgi:23S rRNA (uracil1939-C5)-methyltransferase